MSTISDERKAINRRIKKNKQVRIILNELSKIDELLNGNLSVDQRASFNDKKRNLLKRQKALSITKSASGNNIPLPLSYIKEKTEKRDEARSISGRDRVRINFVQGGSAGSKR